MHEFVAHHPCLVEEDDLHFIIQISNSADAQDDVLIRSHFLQLLHDHELRQEIEKSTGKIRDVVIAAAFSQIVTSVDHE